MGIESVDGSQPLMSVPGALTTDGAGVTTGVESGQVGAGTATNPASSAPLILRSHTSAFVTDTPPQVYAERLGGMAPQVTGQTRGLGSKEGIDPKKVDVLPGGNGRAYAGHGAYIYNENEIVKQGGKKVMEQPARKGTGGPMEPGFDDVSTPKVDYRDMATVPKGTLAIAPAPNVLLDDSSVDLLQTVKDPKDLQKIVTSKGNSFRLGGQNWVDATATSSELKATDKPGLDRIRTELADFKVYGEKSYFETLGLDPKYYGGPKMPNYTLGPPGYAGPPEAKDHVFENSMTTGTNRKLSSILKPNAGVVYWAACTANLSVSEASKQ